MLSGVKGSNTDLKRRLGSNLHTYGGLESILKASNAHHDGVAWWPVYFFVGTCNLPKWQDVHQQLAAI